MKRVVYSNRLKHLRQSAFTLMELLIIITLIAVVAAVALILFNPKKQLEKAWDSKRKKELNTLQKVFEDFYNDNNNYPLADNVCYDAVQMEGNTCSCHICGQTDKSSFSPYLARLPCDPQQKNYLYQFDCSNSKPQWFRLCSILSNQTPSGVYNYGVASGNIDPADCPPITPPGGAIPQITPTITPTVPPPSVTPTTPPGATATPTPTITPAGETPTPTPATCPSDPAPKYCKKDSICNNCGTFLNCQSPGSCNQPLQLYQDSNCTIPCN